MTRVLLTVSGVVPDSLDDDIAAGRRPRVDYRAMAAASGFEVFDERQGLAASRLGRLVARVAGAHVGSSIALYRASRDVDVVLTDAECTGLPLAVWFRLDVVARLRRRRRPRHVMISHRLAWGRKITLHRLLRLDRQIDAYIVYATEQRRRLIEDMGIAPAKVELTGFTVDECFWRPTPIPTEGRPVICAAGLERRDYGTLLAAIDGLDVDLVIAAGSPWAVRGWSPEGRLPPHVTVTTFDFPGLRDLYARSRFVVVPLEAVDFQAGVTSILEAMAMGRPVLYTATAGQTDVVVDGVTGTSVPPTDAGAMREAIVALLADEDGLRRMGEAARRDVESRFGLDGYVRRISAIACGQHAARVPA